eukprot:TRINITY_DN29017_c0_g1_i1.p1 TRINITY_DN29017_c0_g1~~TRINITY_DN29017_c0_g1_i1.p1  ORF type:complete len:478 (+),score=129.96 TRINITY_DN29017_c0_g1_i1:89-1522(+)
MESLPLQRSGDIQAQAGCSHLALPQRSAADDGDVLLSQWLEAQAAAVTSLEQKLIALSRRTSAELRRAEREKGDQDRRLEILEDLCRQHLGGLEDRLVQAQEDIAVEAERRLQSTSEQMQEEAAASLKALEARVEADHRSLEELRSWRRQADSILCIEDGGPSRSGSSSRLIAGRSDACCREDVVLREELRQVEDRFVALSERLQGDLKRVRHDVREAQARCEDSFSSQLEELGGALASRMQGKLSSTTQDFRQRLDSAFGQLQDFVRRECREAREAASEEARTVHLEVMTVDTRLASLEERGRSSSEQGQGPAVPAARRPLDPSGGLRRCPFLHQREGAVAAECHARGACCYSISTSYDATPATNVGTGLRSGEPLLPSSVPSTESVGSARDHRRGGIPTMRPEAAASGARGASGTGDNSTALCTSRSMSSVGKVSDHRDGGPQTVDAQVQWSARTAEDHSSLSALTLATADVAGC